MIRLSLAQILRMSVVVLSFTSFCLGLSRWNNPSLESSPGKGGESIMESSESIERRTSQPETTNNISPREHRLYPLYFTRTAAVIPTVLVAPVLERFYNKFIENCQAKMRNGLQPGFFLDEMDNELQLIVISQGMAISWPFVINFATRMKGRISRGWTATYDAYYASAPGDVIVLKSCLETMAYPDIPYWRANVPEDQWPTRCPEFLQNLSERDEKLVGRLDEDYHRLTWPEVKEVVGNVKEVMLQSAN
ncbi:MAG: hypothetical protein Q9225_003824 [Loekoesia sp. 1 TL-2023]